MSSHGYGLKYRFQSSKLLAAILLTVCLPALVPAQDPGQVEKEIANKAFQMHLGKARAGMRRTADPLAIPKSVGWMQEFEGGRVYWTTLTGAIAVRGDILNRWLAQGAEKGEFGFPLYEEAACEPQGPGNRFQIFEYAAIYWNATSRQTTTQRIQTPGVFNSLPNCSENRTTPVPVNRGNRFRVILTGFTVNHQTSDHILEADGKGDEVFIAAEVARFDNYGSNGSRRIGGYPQREEIGDYLDHIEGFFGAGRMTLRRSLTSVVMGDADNTASRRVRAGSAGEWGGLRTGDSFPSNQPWFMEGRTLSDNRLPMLLWEGEFNPGKSNDFVIIIPTIWEWDDGDPNARRQFTEAADKYLNVYAQNLGAFVGAYFGSRDVAGAGDRPIGWWGSPRAIRLTYDIAAQAVTESPAKHGPGVYELRYETGDPAESYSLFITIDRPYR
jgi:hypothetical protein